MKWVALGSVLLSSACTPTQPLNGVACVWIVELDSACPVTASGQPRPINELATLPFRRTHGVAAFEGGSAWTGGNVIAIAWSEADGTIGRLFFDIGPDRGYGITAQPSTSQESLGFVTWNNTERYFAATRVTTGLVDYLPNASLAPGEFFANVMFEGIGRHGEVACRIIGVHASTALTRNDAYDPTWLAPDPTAMFSSTTTPDFSGDSAPSLRPVAPSSVTADPGGPAPPLVQHSDYALDGGDGRDACD